MKLQKNVEKNIANIKKVIPSQDLIYYKFNAGEIDFYAIYIDSITEKTDIGELLIKPMHEYTPKNLSEAKDILQIANIEEVKTIKDLTEKLLSGRAALLCDGDDSALMCDFYSFQMRPVGEPPTSAVVKGPREGFNECLKINISLLRRRLKVNDLIIEYLTVGKYSNTSVALCYIDSITDKAIVDEVREKIQKINIDGIPDSSYIAKLIVNHRLSLFKQVGSTEKPDILAEKILEGRVGIICDGTPIALTAPYMLVEDFQSSEDYFANSYRANMERIIRILSIFFALFLPSMFVAAQLFHLQIIPLNFLLTIVNSIKGIPLSPTFEMFFTLLIFEILNEASIRMPKYVGMALSIVGALVLGDTAVKAGIVSTPTIMIMALSGICLYTVPELVDSMSVLRLVYLMAAGSIGGYGIILVSAFIFVYLCSLDNFGVPILSPYAPSIPSDKKDALVREHLTNFTRRPEVLNSKNKIRMRLKKENKNQKNSETATKKPKKSPTPAKSENSEMSD